MKANLSVQNWKIQYEAVSELRNNSQQEVDELYQVKKLSTMEEYERRADVQLQYFNEELDNMFNEASLPDDDAWAAMTKRMTQAQQGKAKVEHENM